MNAIVPVPKGNLDIGVLLLILRNSQVKSLAIGGARNPAGMKDSHNKTIKVDANKEIRYTIPLKS